MLRRFSRSACLLVATAGVGLALSVMSPASAQISLPGLTSAPPENTPAKPAAEPLARYAPGESLWFYLEFDGVANHANAWNASAASKILNQTKTGTMLEDLASQVLEQGMKSQPERKLAGTDVIQLIEHALQHGILFASSVRSSPTPGGPTTNDVIVFRGAAAKESRPLFGKLLGSVMKDDDKTQAVTGPGGRKIITIKTAAGATWAFWTDGDNLIITPGDMKDADIVAELLDGKRPNAIDNPIRTELFQAEGAFQPVGILFADLTMVPNDAGAANQFVSQSGLQGLKRVDLRWGLDGDAIKNIVRLDAPAPRNGLLSLFDQPTFSASALPPMPSSLKSFSAFSLDPVAVYDQVSGMVPPRRRTEPLERLSDGPERERGHRVPG